MTRGWKFTFLLLCRGMLQEYDEKPATNKYDKKSNNLFNSIMQHPSHLL
jgi:hypothetical protein